jgi:hypothetical protein
MSVSASTILANLQTVFREREYRSQVAGLEAKVHAIKQFQQLRFAHTYADLLASERYRAASLFFLNELYGPSDFTGRDAQFVRVIPALVKLFPKEIVETVATLSELHALSETLDTRMGNEIAIAQVTAANYVAAWLRVGSPAERETQIASTLSVATRLDRLTRNPLVRNSLRFMKGPARAAGLSDLQRFLELGFDTFRAMRGTEEFVGIVGSRERVLASALFGVSRTFSDQDGSMASALAMLP